MSRREVALNTALGLLLILVFAAPFVLLMIVGQFLFHTLAPSLERYYSLLGLPEGILDVALFSALCLWIAIVDIRRRYWSNSVLALAVIPSEILNWITKASPLTVVWPFIFLYLILIQRRLNRWEFATGGLIVSISVVLSTGILGSATARLAQDLLILAVVAWFSLALRRGDVQLSNSSPAACA